MSLANLNLNTRFLTDDASQDAVEVWVLARSDTGTLEASLDEVGVEISPDVADPSNYSRIAGWAHIVIPSEGFGVVVDEPVSPPFIEPEFDGSKNNEKLKTWFL